MEVGTHFVGVSVLAGYTTALPEAEAYNLQPATKAPAAAEHLLPHPSRHRHAGRSFSLSHKHCDFELLQGHRRSFTDPIAGTRHLHQRVLKLLHPRNGPLAAGRLNLRFRLILRVRLVFSRISIEHREPSHEPIHNQPMAAPDRAAVLSHKKRARRRRQDKPAISARLILDDHIKGDVGILSEDLFSDLFPHLRDGTSLSP